MKYSFSNYLTVDIYGRFFQDGIELINNAKINVFYKCKNEDFFPAVAISELRIFLTTNG